MRSRQIAEIIVSWMTIIQSENHRVVTIVTTQHTTTLNPVFLKPHFFPTQLSITPPNLEARVKVQIDGCLIKQTFIENCELTKVCITQILKKLICQRKLDPTTVDLQTVALNCEGYLGSYEFGEVSLTKSTVWIHEIS
jgi:SpoVK/Ycf46/Vps4 family AAA+-type ATPase